MKKLIICLATAVLLMTGVPKSQAYADEISNVYSLNTEYSIWQDKESKAIVNVSKDEDSITVTVDTTNMKEYYEIFTLDLIGEQLFSIENSKTISMTYSLEADKDMFISYKMNSVDGSSISSKGEKNYMAFINDFYAIKIPENTQYALTNDATEILVSGEDFDYSKCTNANLYGVTLTFGVVKGTKYTLDIKNMKVVEDTSVLDTVTFSGESEIAIPEIGEYWYQYEVDGFEVQSYEILNAPEGCSIDENGRITLDKTSQPGKCTVIAKGTADIYAAKSITITDSYHMYEFLNPDVDKKVTYPLDFVSDKMIKTIRIAGIVVIAATVVIAVIIIMSIKREEEED